MRRQRSLVIIAAALAGAGIGGSFPAPAEARAARCVIAIEGERYAGPCDFRSERGGSFSVERADGGSLPGGAAMLSLTLIARGMGEVRALTDRGISARWGEAERSSSDPACWLGDSFSLCAY